MVRQSFRCLQIVTTDHLSTLDNDGLSKCIDTVARFCSQQADLNISLTAVGLLWKIVDHLSSSGQGGSNGDDDSRWVKVYNKLGELCVDNRPPLRKSAAQTLFEALAAHSDRLKLQTFADLLWTVVFPLFDSVCQQAGVKFESDDKPDRQIALNEAKVWAEAHNVIISGASRLFAQRQRVLKQMDNCSDVWQTFLNYLSWIAGHALPNEVSHSAVKALLELCSTAWPVVGEPSNTKEIQFVEVEPPHFCKALQNGQKVCNHPPEQVPYCDAWPAWLYITKQLTKPSGNMVNNKPDVPTQQKLTDLIKALAQLIPKILTMFKANDCRKMIESLGGLIAVPVAADAAPFVLPAISNNYEAVMTQLQENVVGVLQNSQEVCTW